MEIGIWEMEINSKQVNASNLFVSVSGIAPCDSAATFFDSPTPITTARDPNINNTKSEPEICRLFANDASSTTEFDLLTSAVLDPKASQQIAAPPELDFEPVQPKYKATVGLEDSVSSLLQEAENDRKHVAWIPGEKARKAFSDLSKSPPGAYLPDRSLLTMPGIILQDELPDLFQDVLLKHCDDSVLRDRKLRIEKIISQLPQDVNGVGKLIELGLYRAAINLTGKLLTLYGQGVSALGHPTKNTPKTLHIWNARFMLLIKLRQFNLVEREAAAFGELDNPDLFYQFFPGLYPSRKGSMVPFTMRLLLAQLPAFLGRYQESITRLNNLLSVAKQIVINYQNDIALNASEKEEAIEIWNTRQLRIKLALVNTCVINKEYFSAVAIITEIVKSIPHCELKRNSEKASLYSSLAVVLLQFSDVKSAQVMFEKAEQLRDDSPADMVAGLLDRSYLAIAQNGFQDAYLCLKSAYEIDPRNATVINNMSVCLVYAGKLQEALDSLESILGGTLHDVLLFNIATLYELECTTNVDKKRTLLSKIAITSDDLINSNSLKLPT